MYKLFLLTALPIHSSRPTSQVSFTAWRLRSHARWGGLIGRIWSVGERLQNYHWMAAYFHQFSPKEKTKFEQGKDFLFFFCYSPKAWLEHSWGKKPLTERGLFRFKTDLVNETNIVFSRQKWMANVLQSCVLLPVISRGIPHKHIDNSIIFIKTSGIISLDSACEQRYLISLMCICSKRFIHFLSVHLR